MAFMSESSKSLKNYFLFIGGLSLLSGLSNVSNNTGLFLILSVLGILVSAAYVGIGLKFDELLVHPARPIEIVLYVSIGQSVAFAGAAMFYGLATTMLFVVAGIGVAIAAYLLKNTRRLRLESNSATASNFD